MPEQPSQIDIHAYVDDQLDAGHRYAVEVHLAKEPAQAAEVMSELSRKTALRMLAGADHDDAASRLDAPRPRTGRWLRTLPPLGGMAVAAAAAGLLFLPDRPPAYVNMAVASHRVAMMRAHMVSQIEAPALDSHEVRRGTGIDLPSLPVDWKVTDAQVFPTYSGPALLVAVTTLDGRKLSIFAVRERSGAPEMPDAVREGAQSVAYWRRGDMSYALTGDGEPHALDATAEGLTRSWL